MDVFLPKGFEPGLGRAPMSVPARAKRLSVEASGIHYPVLRRWATGFAVSAQDVPELSGLTTLRDGAQVLAQGLILRCESEGDERIYTTKRVTVVDYAAQTEFSEPGRRPFR